MRWLRNNAKSISVLLLISAIFYWMSWVLHVPEFEVTVVNLNQLKILPLGASTFFFSILCVWLAFEIFFNPLNRFIDIGHFEDAFNELETYQQILTVAVVFLALFYLFIRCCMLFA